MLDTRAAQTAIDLTLETSSKGIMLAAIPDTPLALLCRQTPLELTDRSADTLSAAAEEMVNLTRGEEHAGVLATTVTMAAESVRRTLDLARNTTMPHIRRVIALFDEYVSNAAQAASPYNVLPVYLPDVFKTDTAERLLSGYASVLPQSVEGNPFFGKFSPDEIRELVRVTNDGEFNELIDELLMADNGKVLAEVGAGLEGLLNVKRISPDAALPLLIVLKNIETPKEGVATNLSKYNADREIFAANVGKIAATQVQRVTQSTATSALYPITGDDLPTNIRVNGEAYAKLLSKGLSVEAVIGNELLGRKYRGELMVTEEALKDMIGAYNRDKAIRQQAHEVRKSQVIRKGVLEALRSDHAYVTGEGNGMQIAGDSSETSWIRLREFVDAVYAGPAQSAEPAVIIAGTICQVWYGHTDAGRVINAMMSVEKANPGLETREVATLATLRYISDWVASQIAVVDNSDV
jgi:hypothetical protein